MGRTPERWSCLRGSREVGIAIHATASDDDGGVTIRKWVWELSDEVTFDRGVPSKECQDDTGTPGIDAVRRRRLDRNSRGLRRQSTPRSRPTSASAFGRVAVYTDNVGHGEDAGRRECWKSQ